ncbi:MAG TPA: hypothetical protein VNC60_05265, partial [Actinomycetota bacterium]|nr:hypothetical protein [Actinomycetota bacterium]
GHDCGVNEQSLDRVNAFLTAAAERTQVGDVMTVTPAEIGRELGFPDALSTARAVRALIARKRLEPAQGSYRLLSSESVDPAEKESIGRRPRKPRQPRQGPASKTGTGAAPGAARYSDLGRAVVDRLVDLGREAAELRAALRSAREETSVSRQARDEAEGRARALSEKVRELEARAEMAESNLRTLLATVRATGAEGSARDARVSDSEMEAILGVLKGGDVGAANPDDPATADAS